MSLIVQMFAGNEIRIVEQNGTHLWVAQDVARELGINVKNIAREVTARVFDDEEYVQKTTLLDARGQAREYDVLTQRGLIMFIHSTPKEVAENFKKWSFFVQDELIKKGVVTLRESVRDLVNQNVPVGSQYFAEVAMLERASNDDKDETLITLRKRIAQLEHGMALVDAALRATTKDARAAVKKDLEAVLYNLDLIGQGSAEWPRNREYITSYKAIGELVDSILDSDEDDATQRKYLKYQIGLLARA